MYAALGATATYSLPIAPPGSRGGPYFPDGAFSKDDCYDDVVNVSGQGKMPLIPPAGSLPPDVRDVKNWNIQQTGPNSWRASAAVTRCGTRKQCLEALYDPASKTWYCSTLGDPCGGDVACAPVPSSAFYTWTDDFVQGKKKVPATADGLPIFAPAVSPTTAVGDALSASNLTPWLLGGAAILALLFLKGR